jgi:acyl-CoA thioesterase-1
MRISAAIMTRPVLSTRLMIAADIRFTMRNIQRAAAGRLCPPAILLLLAIVSPALGQTTGAVPAASERRTVVVLGDSLAAGLGVEPEQAFPSLLQKKIDAAGWAYTVVNAGVSGDTSADGLARIDWLLRRSIDVLVLELGGNDGLRGIPVSATRTNLQGILDRVTQKFPQARLIVTGMQMPPNMGEEYTTAFRKIFPELAVRNHAALVPFLLEGVGGKPELNQEDRIHPTAAGHEIVAENVWNVLKPVLVVLNKEQPGS